MGLVIWRVMFFSLVIGGGFFLGFKGLQIVAIFGSVRGWTSTTGTVMDVGRTATGGRSRRGGQIFQCNVRYNYTVNGTAHTGARASIYSNTGDSGLCYLRRRDPTKDNMNITVYYDPRNPEESALGVHFNAINLAMFYVGSAGMVALGMVGIFGPGPEYIAKYPVLSLYVGILGIILFSASIDSLRQGALGAVLSLFAGVVLLACTAVLLFAWKQVA